MRMFISAFATFALSALMTCQAIVVNQTYSHMTVASAIHSLHNFAETNQFAQYIYNSGVLGHIPQDSLTVFYPLSSAGLPADLQTDQRLVDLVRYHVTSQLVSPVSEDKRGVTVSTYLISPNPETNMNNGTAQRFIATFDANNLTLNSGRSVYPTSNMVYNCTNGFIYMLDVPLSFPTLPSEALAEGKVTTVSFGSSNVSDYLNNLTSITFFTSPDASYNTIDQVNSHVVSGVYYRTDMKNGESLQTVGGQSVSIMATNGSSVTIDNMSVVRTIPVWNGVVLVVSNGNSTVNLNNSTTTPTVTLGNVTVDSSASTLSAMSGAFAVMAALLAAVSL